MTRNEIFKQRRIDYFKNHCKVIRETMELKQSIAKSIQGSYIVKDLVANPEAMNVEIKSDKYNIRVIPFTTIHAAKLIHDAFGEDKIAVLNFASAKYPGGYVVGGSSAQEESICRASTLYHVLSDRKFTEGYYEYNKMYAVSYYDDSNIYHRYTDRMIYTPDIKVIAVDTEDLNILPKYLYEGSWFNIDVITSPAPNLNLLWKKTEGHIDVDKGNEFGRPTIRSAYQIRIENMIRVAIKNHVDDLVLGAWGCGVFKNNPSDVASEFYKVLVDKGYYKYFKHIYFAIIDDFRSVSSPYKIFNGMFGMNDM